eukprot:TRINITY_DN3710_c0_g5_i1.p1 TRINITY_DN3710_c0_g5~~TRINITY_DN3710_c0_g5_i1.p1  ORF type:complete len:417 (+),score=91.77 TRINITY_DN3710_c0_g5_i1:898-2148(+)
MSQQQQQASPRSSPKCASSPAKRRPPMLAPLVIDTGSGAAPAAGAAAPAACRQPAYCVTRDGTFREGDLEINRQGLLIAGTSPVCHRNKTPITGERPAQQPVETMRLDDLQVIKPLGKGSGGEVKKVLHVPTNTVYALKVVKLEVEEVVRKRILLELKTLYKLQAENVIAFYDAFFTEGCIHMVLEYMDVGSLQDIIRKGPIKEQTLANIALQVLRGLAYIHKQHLIHRDIKPSNILVNSNGVVKIADFGVSEQRQHTFSTCVSWIGTVTYMSPERIAANSYKIDSDIWSVGMTVHECATGKYPYQQRSAPATAKPTPRQPIPPVETGDAASALKDVTFFELLQRIRNEPAPRLLADRFSKELCSFVEACLQKSPQDRPAALALLSHPFAQKGAQVSAEEMAQWARTATRSQEFDF